MKRKTYEQEVHIHQNPQAIKAARYLLSLKDYRGEYQRGATGSIYLVLNHIRNGRGVFYRYKLRIL